jgi:uncharacterized protein YllA (UPF0747 family)
LKNSGRAFILQELLEYSDRKPELFSPNVLLRPLIQDHLFPTAAYVGGPAELAYFAQIEALYALFERPMPVVWPRNAFTLVEPEIAAEMDRMGVDIQDCFQNTDRLIEKIIFNSRFSETIVPIDDLHDLLDRTLTEIRPDIEALEPPLAQAMDTARRKILHNVRRLKSQAIRLQSEQSSYTLSSANLLINHCFPGQALQERQFGILHFLAYHGYSLLDAIRKNMAIGNFAHRVLRLE